MARLGRMRPSAPGGHRGGDSPARRPASPRNQSKLLCSGIRPISTEGTAPAAGCFTQGGRPKAGAELIPGSEKIDSLHRRLTVMAGLVLARPGHPSRHGASTDGRDKPGHDARRAAHGVFIRGRSANGRYGTRNDSRSSSRWLVRSKSLQCSRNQRRNSMVSGQVWRRNPGMRNAAQRCMAPLSSAWAIAATCALAAEDINSG
jgi:hypothetical protein